MRFMIAALLIAVAIPSIAYAKSVHGYYKKDGTYVAPYHRTSPNSHKYDNYSSHSQVNPYTGKKGTKRDEFSSPPAYNKSLPKNR